MKIIAQRDLLLTPLTQVSGVVEKRQTLPILSNLLMEVHEERLEITATDLEIELRTSVAVESEGEGAFTVPARKMLEICRALPAGSELSIQVEGERAVVRSGKSRFTLSILPAQDFPSIEASPPEQVVQMEQGLLRRLIHQTAFAMAQQDVRYYLNGLLLELRPDRVRVVATDGHRLALSEQEAETGIETPVQAIVPRKAVLEIGRLLLNEEQPVKIELSSNHIRLTLDGTRFLSKLIDGRFPDYERVIPGETRNHLVIERETLRQALIRASILSNEKYRGVRFHVKTGVLVLQAHNPEQEEAEEEVPVEYDGEEIDIGFNVGYLLDVLNVVENEAVVIGLNDANSSALIQGEGEPRDRYVIMPMRL